MSDQYVDLPHPLFASRRGHVAFLFLCNLVPLGLNAVKAKLNSLFKIDFSEHVPEYIFSSECCLGFHFCTMPSMLPWIYQSFKYMYLFLSLVIFSQTFFSWSFLLYGADSEILVYISITSEFIKMPISRLYTKVWLRKFGMRPENLDLAMSQVILTQTSHGTALWEKNDIAKDPKQWDLVVNFYFWWVQWIWLMAHDKVEFPKLPPSPPPHSSGSLGWKLWRWGGSQCVRGLIGGKDSPAVRASLSLAGAPGPGALTRVVMWTIRPTTLLL